MVCASCAAKARARSKKKDVTYYYMSYIWANPTWDFLHSFAARVNEDFFAAKKGEMLNIVKSLVAVLPCPDCQGHALSFFGNKTVQNIPTKESFIELLLNFHNDVNVRTRKTPLTLEDLEKYKRSHFLLITQIFLNIMSQYKSTLVGFAETRARQSVLRNINNWVNRYGGNF